MGLYRYGTSTFESRNMISVSSVFTLSGLIQQSQHYVRTGNVNIIMWNLFRLVSVPTNLSASCQYLGVFFVFFYIMVTVEEWNLNLQHSVA